MENKLIIQIPTEEEVKFIYKKVKEENEKKNPFTIGQKIQMICRVIKDEKDDVIAGIVGYVHSNLKSLDISLVWVKEEFRKSGYGTILLQNVEREVFEKGITLVYLGTLGFQAKDFYLKHGYKVFGVVDECVQNNKVYYIKKKLNKTNINLEINKLVQVGTGDDANYIGDEIVKFNAEKVPFTNKLSFEDIDKVIKDSDGNIIAGISTILLPWTDLQINTIWASEGAMEEKLKTKLLSEIENELKEKEGHVVMYETFDDKAKDLFVKNGYEVYGILDDYDEDYKVYYMKKVF